MILINYRLSQKFELLENDEFNQLTIILTDMIAKLLLHYAVMSSVIKKLPVMLAALINNSERKQHIYTFQF